MKENQHVEWKETWRDEYLPWGCAFANADGGVLEIGRSKRACDSPISTDLVSHPDLALDMTP